MAHIRSVTPCKLVSDEDRASQDDAPVDVNPEDGITQKVVAQLKTRKKADNIKKWSQLWELLFGENDVPKPKGILFSHHPLPPPNVLLHFVDRRLRFSRI
jgi:hypothetical protein